MIIHQCDQGSDEWYKLRAGIPTASEFKKLITSKGEPSKSASDYAISLAAEKYAGKTLDSFSGNMWTDRGQELEPEASATYALTRGCNPCSVGFVTDDDKTYGCSPDRLVNDDGMVEFKCLKTENHIKIMVFYRTHGRAPSDYIAQTQGQLFVCEREWCDLAFYHPELPMVIIRQTFNEKFANSLLEQIESVIYERDRIFQLIQEF